jgi:hypothetical protein
MRGSQGLSGLALLLLLVGCAAQPVQGRAHWYGQNGHGSAQDFSQTGRAGQQGVEVDFEAPTPQRAEELRRSGVELPRVSERTADPRTHRDFIDRRVTDVGFGISEGGYLLYCEGLALPVLVPESHADLRITSAAPLSAAIHPDRNAALEAVEDSGSGGEPVRYAYYRGAGGALIVPTVFSPATTPRIARTMLEVRQHLSEAVQRELKVLLLTLTGTKVVQGVFSRVVRVGSEPSPRPVAQKAEPRSEAPASRPATPASAPASEPLAPSPGLVQALTGTNPTPRMVPGTRLPQDVAVKPSIPKKQQTSRSIGPSPTQNAQLQADIDYLENVGATNIRVNQQQLTQFNGQRVGINRPDLQFDYNGRRYHVEYDTPSSGRGLRHQERITSNDPSAEIILLIVP